MQNHLPVTPTAPIQSGCVSVGGSRPVRDSQSQTRWAPLFPSAPEAARAIWSPLGRPIWRPLGGRKHGLFARASRHGEGRIAGRPFSDWTRLIGRVRDTLRDRRARDERAEWPRPANGAEMAELASSWLCYELRGALDECFARPAQSPR